MIRKLILASAVFAFIACSGDGGSGPARVTTVAVTITPSAIQVFGTAQASAVPKDQNGNVLGNRSVTWSSLTPSVASVSSEGNVTAIAPGLATIQATVDGVAATGSVQIAPAVTVCNSGPTTVSLAAGEVKVLTSSATQGCIKIPAATSAPADYLVIPANLNPQYPDVLATFTFRSDEGETIPANTVFSSRSNVLASGLANSVVRGVDMAAQSDFENRLRLNERRILHLRDAHALIQSRELPTSVRYSTSVAIPAIGDKSNFKVPAQTSSCTSFTTISAQVKYINDKVIIYSDVASPAGGFTPTDFQQIGDEFANLIYATDVSYFGSPLDLDKNGRVIMLYTAEVNKLTPAGNPSSLTGGFFWAGDLFDPKLSTSEGGCPQSNLAELFYLLTPDPTGTINGNIRNTATVRQLTRGTIAHEFQHMINASERIKQSVDFEDVWLDEALSHFAEDAVGRAVRGIGEKEDANFERTLGGNVDDFNAFFFQNFSRFRIYLKSPADSSPVSTLAAPSLAVRGAAWALLHYAADHYAPGGDVKAFTRKLTAGPELGVANLTKNAGVAFDVIAKGFLIANYADNIGIPGLDPLYTYLVYDMRSNETALPANFGAYPLKVTTITSGGIALSGIKVRSGGGGSYFFFPRGPGATARTFRMINPDGSTAASYTNASWILLRTQ